MIIVAHPPKNGSEYSGSTDWLAGVRALITLTEEKLGQPPGRGKPDTRRLGIKLESVKTSYAERPRTLQLDRESTRSIPDEKGVSVKGYVWKVMGPWPGTTPPVKAEKAEVLEPSAGAEWGE